MSKIAFMFPGQERRQPEWEKILRTQRDCEKYH